MLRACKSMNRPQPRCVAEALWLANTRYGSFGSPLGLVLAQDGGGLPPPDSHVSEVTMPYPAWAHVKTKADMAGQRGPSG